MKKDQLYIAVEHANSLFKILGGKYHKLKAHLVLSSPFGQCDLTDDLVKILKSFPEMIVDSDNKKYCLKLLDKEKKYKNDNVKLSEVKKELSSFSDSLTINKDVFIEMRFASSTELDLIFTLKEDSLVSSQYTSSSRASIRVVLGTVEEIYQRSEKYMVE